MTSVALAGKMLLLSLVFGVQSSCVILASASGLHSSRVQKHGERSGGASERKGGAWPGKCHFDHKRGDLFTTLRVYQAWLQERSRHARGGDQQSRRWCREHGLDERLLFELNKPLGTARCVCECTRMNVQLCELLRDGAGGAGGTGQLGLQLRRAKLARLQERLWAVKGRVCRRRRWVKAAGYPRLSGRPCRMSSRSSA